MRGGMLSQVPASPSSPTRPTGALDRTDVSPVLRASGSELVGDQVLSTDDRQAQPLDLDFHPAGPRRVELDAWNAEEEIHTGWHATHPYDFVGRGSSQVVDNRLRRPERPKPAARPQDVFASRVEPHVQIFCRPWSSVHPHGVSADDQVPNFCVAERRKHRDQIGGEDHSDVRASRTGTRARSTRASALRALPAPRMPDRPRRAPRGCRPCLPPTRAVSTLRSIAPPGSRRRAQQTTHPRTRVTRPRVLRSLPFPAPFPGGVVLTAPSAWQGSSASSRSSRRRCERGAGRATPARSETLRCIPSRREAAGTGRRPRSSRHRRRPSRG